MIKGTRSPPPGIEIATQQKKKSTAKRENEIKTLEISISIWISCEEKPVTDREERGRELQLRRESQVGGLCGYL